MEYYPLAEIRFSLDGLSGERVYIYLERGRLTRLSVPHPGIRIEMSSKSGPSKSFVYHTQAAAHIALTQVRLSVFSALVEYRPVHNRMEEGALRRCSCGLY